MKKLLKSLTVILFATMAIGQNLPNINTGTKGQLPVSRLESGTGGTQCLFTDSLLVFWGTCPGGGGGSGTVTSVSIGNLTPVFTASVTNPTTTPSIAYTLTNAPSNTFFGNNLGSAAAPQYFQAKTTNLVDFSPTAPTTSGKVPIFDQPSGTYIPGDPLVQGVQADGSTTAVNPVAIGGYDTAGTPVLHRSIFLNGNPAGTEYGIVTRNIPSGTQATSVSNFPATQPISGTVTANAGSGTFAVSGTVSTTPPSNASTNVAQVAGTTVDTNSGAKSAGTQRIVIATDQPQLTNALKVDGSGVTQPVSGTVSIQSNASVNLTQIGGTAQSAANVVDSGNAAFKVNCVVGCSSTPGFTDNSAFTAGTTTIANIGGIFNDGLSAVTSTNAAAARITSSRALHINLRNNSGTEIGTASTPVQVSLANTAANATAVKTDGSAVTQPVSIAGTVTVSGTVTTTPPSNASTNIAQINGITPLMGNGVTGTGSQRVTIASDNTAFGVNATLQTGANTVGKVDVLGNAGAAMDAAGQNATSPANELLTGCQFNTSPTTITTGNMSPMQCDNAGNHLVNLKTALPAGANVIGHTINDTGSTTAVTGNVTVVQTTGTNLHVDVDTALPAGTNVIGHTINDSGSTTAVTGTVTIAGAKTNNNAAPGATNAGVIPAIANAAAPTWTEGNQVLESVDLSGNARTLLSSWFGSTAPTVGSKTSANSIPVVIASDQAAVTVAQATAANLNMTGVGTLADNGVAAATNRLGILPGIYQTTPGNGTAATQGRNASLSVGTDGMLWVASLPARRPASYSASKKYAASSTTDNFVIPGNATTDVLVTKLRLTCTQTTAGAVNVEVIKRSAADTSGTSANITAVPDDSGSSAASSTPLSYTGTGPSVGTAVGDVDNAQIGCNATATVGPNDIYILNRQQKPIVLIGTAQQLAINLGGAVTGGNITVSVEWIEVTHIVP